MSLFFRGAEEQRAITSVPWVEGGPSPASTADALALVPVFAAVRLIADSIASLPLQAFRKSGDGRVRVPLPSLFEKPGEYGTTVDWVSTGIASLLLRGNAYGLKLGHLAEFGAMPTAVKWLAPSKVRWESGEWWYDGRPVPERQMLHIPGLAVPGSRIGVSPLTACRAAVEAGMSAQRFASDWYVNKAIPGMVFQNTERPLDPDAAAAAKQRVGATLRAGEPFVIGKDWKLDVLTLSADDAGFVQSSRLTATQVANIYGIPPEMIGGESASSMTYSTVELNQIQFLTNTLRPWIVRLEAAFSALLPKPRYVKFNVDAMVRVDTKTRWEIAQIARTIGAKSADEIRALEELPPLPDGLGTDYTPLAKLATTKEAKP